MSEKGSYTSDFGKEGPQDFNPSSLKAQFARACAVDKVIPFMDIPEKMIAKAILNHPEQVLQYKNTIEQDMVVQSYGEMLISNSLLDKPEYLPLKELSNTVNGNVKGLLDAVADHTKLERYIAENPDSVGSLGHGVNGGKFLHMAKLLMCNPKTRNELINIITPIEDRENILELAERYKEEYQQTVEALLGKPDTDNAPNTTPNFPSNNITSALNPVGIK